MIQKSNWDVLGGFNDTTEGMRQQLTTMAQQFVVEFYRYVD